MMRFAVGAGLKRLLLQAVALISVSAFGQTTIDLRTQSRNVDFSGASSTRLQTGAVLPATCSVGQVFFNTAAAAGSNWYGCAATNSWIAEGSGGGGGGSSLSVLTVSATGTVMTIGAGCSVLVPCNARVGSTVFAFTSAATATLLSGTGTAFVYVDSNGALTVGHNLGTGSVSCSGPCAAVNGITAFPADSIPLSTWTASSGAWVSSGGTDQRAFLSQKVITCGANMTCANSGTSLTISSSGVGGGSGLTAPQVDFADHASTATTSQQTLSTLNIAAGSMSTNNNYAILAISGIQASSNNLIYLNFGGTIVPIGTNSANPQLGVGSGTTFSVECKVIRTASNAEKISCVSGVGQNVAFPYVNASAASVDLTASVAITILTSTNGTAGDVVLKTFEFRPVNF